MRVVLGGGLWPIGQLVGFLEAPFETVVEEMRSWKRSLGAHWRPRRLSIEEARRDYARSSARP